MVHVYELINNDEVVWVGETISPKRILWQHTSNTVHFTDMPVAMNIFESFLNRKEANDNQNKLNKHYVMRQDN